MTSHLLCTAAALLACASVGSAQFAIHDDAFWLDGKKIQLLSGSFHYARTPRGYWPDTLQRMKALGLNTVQTYVPWNWHEEKEGVFNFEGDHDLEAFIGDVKAAGMLLMVRQGPYMCGEWEFGGFPAWLINKNVTIRTYEPNYINYVTKWFNKLQPVLKPHLHSNGGPIIMAQVENEYGSYGNVAGHPADKQYMEYLTTLTKKAFGENATYVYTTDAGSDYYMSRGSLKGSAVVTFGDDGLGKACNAMKEFNPAGMNPCMSTELYTGWLTHWGESMANTSSQGLANALAIGLKNGDSFNLYMAFGGSNFGFFAGSNGGGARFSPHITSYDYDAPISENGDHGFGSDSKDKLLAVREVIQAHYSTPLPDLVPNRVRMALGDVKMTSFAPFMSSVTLDTLTHGKAPFKLAAPTNVEKFGQAFGYGLYSTVAPKAGDVLTISGYVRDRAQVFVDGVRVPGAIWRPDMAPLKGLNARQGSRIDILVEIMGRLNFGTSMFDPKGLATDVTLDGTPLSGAWELRSINLTAADVTAVQTQPITKVPTTGPNFFKGVMNVKGTPKDTYISTLGWGKGMVWVNGFNLGRYWEVKGPQHALFLPAMKLEEGDNEVVVLELEQPSSKLTVASTDNSDFSGAIVHCKATPVEGTVAVMEKCDMPNLQGFTKTDVGSAFTLQAGGFCVTETGDGFATLEPCAAGNKAQMLSYTASQEIKVASSGKCLDIYQAKACWMSNLCPLTLPHTDCQWHQARFLLLRWTEQSEVDSHADSCTHVHRGFSLGMGKNTIEQQSV